MDIISFVVVGVIAGFGGSHIGWWRRDNSGLSMAVGILGAFAGAFLGRALGYSTSDPATFVAATLGAIALVATYLGIVTRRTA